MFWSPFEVSTGPCSSKGLPWILPRTSKRIPARPWGSTRDSNSSYSRNIHWSFSGDLYWSSSRFLLEFLLRCHLKSSKNSGFPSEISLGVFRECPPKFFQKFLPEFSSGIQPGTSKNSPTFLQEIFLNFIWDFFWISSMDFPPRVLLAVSRGVTPPWHETWQRSLMALLESHF